jgi:hypothetical protein
MIPPYSSTFDIRDVTLPTVLGKKIRIPLRVILNHFGQLIVTGGGKTGVEAVIFDSAIRDIPLPDPESRGLERFDSVIRQKKLSAVRICPFSAGRVHCPDNISRIFDFDRVPLVSNLDEKAAGTVPYKVPIK